MTWIEEEATQLLRGRSVLDYCETSIPSRAIVIVHRDLKVSALKVGIRGIDSKNFTPSPRDLRSIQGD